MWGIVDKGTDQVFAKDKSSTKMNKLLPLMEVAYPKRWLEIQRVHPNVELVGQDLKNKSKRVR